PAGAAAPPPRSPEDEQKLKALEQRVLGMFRNIRPGPFAPGIHDIGRESPTRAYLPARNGRPAEPVPPGFLTALRAGRHHEWFPKSGEQYRSAVAHPAQRDVDLQEATRLADKIG